MTDVTYTEIVKSGVLRKLARKGEEFFIKLKGEPDLLVIPQTNEKKKKQTIRYTEPLTIPDQYKSNEYDFSNYDFDKPIPIRPERDDETYATISPSSEQYFTTTDSN